MLYWSFQHSFCSFELNCAYDAVAVRVQFIDYSQRPCSTIRAVSFHYDEVSFLRASVLSFSWCCKVFFLPATPTFADTWHVSRCLDLLSSRFPIPVTDLFTGTRRWRALRLVTRRHLPRSSIGGD